MIRALLLPTAWSTTPPEYLAFQARHHARLHKPDVPYHVISRIFQGRHLLCPCQKLNSIIIGVIGRAQELWPNVELYAVAFMSNHALCAAAHNAWLGMRA